MNTDRKPIIRGTVLFLDVDGVLNASGVTKERFHGCLGIDPAMLARFKRILEESGCLVVLSSTWRKFPAHVQHLREQWGESGEKRFIGLTPVLDRQTGAGIWTARTRGDEIGAWLAENQHVRRFVILDDDGDMGPLLPHLVQTDTFEGLTEAQADEVIHRLTVRGVRHLCESVSICLPRHSAAPAGG